MDHMKMMDEESQDQKIQENHTWIIWVHKRRWGGEGGTGQKDPLLDLICVQGEKLDHGLDAPIPQYLMATYDQTERFS